MNGVSITILDVEPLTSKLRSYFDCPTLEGAYLEQQGDSGNVGSHFERRVFYNEVKRIPFETCFSHKEFKIVLDGW